MGELREYIETHTERGECQCGHCIDSIEHCIDSVRTDTPRHSRLEEHCDCVDMVFFKVSAKLADAETLTELIQKHHGVFCNINLFDGKEYNYIDIGAWLGDQGAALTLMGLGTLLGLWKLLSPKTMLGPMCDDALAMKMAYAGLLSIQTVSK